MLTRMAQESGIETPTAEDLARFDRKRKGKHYRTPTGKPDRPRRQDREDEGRDHPSAFKADPVLFEQFTGRRRIGVAGIHPALRRAFRRPSSGWRRCGRDIGRTSDAEQSSGGPGESYSDVSIRLAMEGAR
jgi:hypothetical protein